MLSRCSLAVAKSGRLPSSASIRRSSGWKITSAPKAMNTDALPRIQRKHLQIQNRRHRRQRQQHDDEADDHRPAARAAHELEGKIDQHREDENLHARAARTGCQGQSASYFLPGQNRFRHPHRLHRFRHVMRADDVARRRPPPESRRRATRANDSCTVRAEQLSR